MTDWRKKRDLSTVCLAHKTILVTGAAGFIGANLSQRLLDEVEGVKVIGLDSVNDYYDVSIKEYRLKQLSSYPAFTFIKGNIA
ncbi:MAG: NAD-dependent epimerase/dehydratase family protein, partial [Clostridiales bacterium]|nr:NAD-dependent epimerase/dehydratase family protein [Clostridiales bacterium]